VRTDEDGVRRKVEKPVTGTGVNGLIEGKKNTVGVRCAYRAQYSSSRSTVNTGQPFTSRYQGGVRTCSRWVRHAIQCGSVARSTVHGLGKLGGCCG